MDKETRALRDILRERDDLCSRLAASDRQLTAALHAWSHRLPGHRGGVATEAGARFLLRQTGLL